MIFHKTQTDPGFFGNTGFFKDYSFLIVMLYVFALFLLDSAAIV